MPLELLLDLLKAANLGQSVGCKGFIKLVYKKQDVRIYYTNDAQRESILFLLNSYPKARDLVSCEIVNRKK